jgi:hypothetical protein
MVRRLILVILLAPLLAAPASAGLLFGGRKADKPDPAQRVPELLGTVKTDGDESKRIDAAGELQQYDPVAFPEIVPALIDVLQNDRKPGVRAEAAQTLSRLRPVSAPVGQALEQAVAKDPSPRVRLQARSALLRYRWSGFSDPPKDETPTARPKDPPPPQTKEPPLAPPPAPTPAPPPRLSPTPAPLPPSLSPAPVTPPPQTARPLPSGPAQPAPSPADDDRGPELAPPP